MRNDSPKRPRRRRGGRADDAYADFYASYYGLDEPTGPPTRHRAAASRTGAALVAGLGALMQRKVVVILTIGLSAVLVLAVGVMASATRTGSDAHHAPSFVDTTGSPTEQVGVPVAEGSSAQPATSPSASAARTSSAPVISTPGNIPVYAQPPVVAGPATTQAAGPSTSQHSSNQPAPAPSTHHSTPPSTTTHTTSSAPPPPPPSTSTSSPSPSPSPSPTKQCIVPDPLHPGNCILAGT
jgi:hypothetical protein